MASIDSFHFLKESDLNIIENWFDNENVRRRMDGLLPLHQWYARVSNEENNAVMMAYDQQLPAGVVIIEFEGDKAYIGLIVNPQHHLQGYGKRILRKLIDDPDFARVSEWAACIEEENQISLSCFKAAGFMLEETEPDEDGFFTLTLRH
ncbi:GNAT family N-acetyltransferase [Bacillus sp. 0909A]|uniref:GNAT family N-acetyltransferase n=1 Tax=Bacillus sp. 0909A TaxID=3120561 RepID=UPI002FDB7E47